MNSKREVWLGYREHGGAWILSTVFSNAGGARAWFRRRMTQRISARIEHVRGVIVSGDTYVRPDTAGTIKEITGG